MLGSMLTATIPALIDLFTGMGKNKTEAAKLAHDVQMLILQNNQEQFNKIMENLSAQATIENTLAENGKNGYRALFAWGLTWGALYGILGLPIIQSILALLGLCGVSVEHLHIALDILPKVDVPFIVGTLGAMIGIYGVREWGKQESMKTLNKQQFYDSLRTRLGPLTPTLVNALEEALSKSPGKI